MISSASSTSVKNKKKLEPTIKKPDITKKPKPTMDKAETKIKIHEPNIKPHEPLLQTTTNRHKSPRQNTKRSPEKNFVDLKHFEVISETQHGVTGLTNFVRNILTNQKFTAKTSFSPIDDKRLILREIALLIRVHHPTIAQVRGVSNDDFEKQNKITILSDFVEKEPLSDVIKKVDLSLFPTNYNNSKRQIILVGVARGMMLLHKHHIVHRDLKPENVLVDDDFHPKIANFGISKIFNSVENLVTNVGSIAYMAPEVFRNNLFSTKSDVYSFGILMFETISNSRVYKKIFESNDFNLSLFKENIINGMKPEFNFPIKKGIRNMIESCLAQNPEDRPSFTELFCKLSLSDEEGFIDFEENGFKSVIKDENDNDNNKFNYCLDEVDLDELFSYVDEIIDDEKSAQNNQEEFEQLINLNNELMNSVKEQKSRISYLTKYITSLKDDNIKLNEENHKLNDENSKLAKDNIQLKNEISQMTNFIPQSQQRSIQLNDQVNNENSIQTQSIEQENQIQSQSIEQENSLQTNLNDQPKNVNFSLTNNEDKNNIERSISANDDNQTKKESKQIIDDANQANFNIIDQGTETNFEMIIKAVKSGKVTSVELPSSLTSIPRDIFKFCNQLKEVKIPQSVQTIESYAFYDCSLLESVDIPSSVTSIGDYSFCLCSLLSKIVIPQSITSIGSHSFSRCTSLTSIEFPSNIKKIGPSCFSWCTSLKSVTIPSSIEMIEECTFFGCSSLLNAKIPSSVKSIGFHCFYKCSSLNEIEIPDSVESVGRGSFNGCLSLSKVKISSSLKEINDYTFFDCSSLKDVEIPSNIKSIGSFAFGDCSSLSNVKIPSSVESIEDNSFPISTKLIK